uniref:Uncharacterized protein n=1 Tax=Rheinheimera sp. BAL341 TaxID=1708203 RepID=A0A486XTT2_9GAMM
MKLKQYLTWNILWLKRLALILRKISVQFKLNRWSVRGYLSQIALRLTVNGWTAVI